MESELLHINKLQGSENWNIWKFQITVILKSYNLWNVVKGVQVMPTMLDNNASVAKKTEYEKKKSDFGKADGTAQRVIVTTLTGNPMIHLVNLENAKEMWKNLVSVYEQKCEASLHILQQQWHSFVKDLADDMATHISKIEDLAYRLKSMGETLDDKMIVSKILLTLPKSFSHFLCAWLSLIHI